MTFEQLLQRLRGHGIRVTIKRSTAAGGSHPPATAAKEPPTALKRPFLVAEWEQYGFSSENDRGSIRVTRDEALELIHDGAVDEAGLTT